ncbi:hypothetical protein L873DRAFT_1185573 [Choiromyces venosus 120613-1]|uniref:Uncharacterized protein n=1 Tax=Choiromyces venosus 120613-1 TaxID=1336337 RepID=A0A3N4K3K6_9PEZI|nr:hypothetical protein L873DRAFT_1185573 [Choiromyces venosus 120613-1]
MTGCPKDTPLAMNIPQIDGASTRSVIASAWWNVFTYQGAPEFLAHTFTVVYGVTTLQEHVLARLCQEKRRLPNYFEELRINPSLPSLPQDNSVADVFLGKDARFSEDRRLRTRHQNTGRVTELLITDRPTVLEYTMTSDEVSHKMAASSKKKKSNHLAC